MKSIGFPYENPRYNSMNHLHHLPHTFGSSQPSHGSSHGTRRARLWAARAAIVPGPRRRGHNSTEETTTYHPGVSGGGSTIFDPCFFVIVFWNTKQNLRTCSTWVLYRFLCRPVFFWGEHMQHFKQRNMCFSPKQFHLFSIHSGRRLVSRTPSKMKSLEP